MTQPHSGAVRVLVADRDWAAADNLTQVLRLHGLDAVAACDPLGVVRFAAPAPPDAVVIDVGLLPLGPGAVVAPPRAERPLIIALADSGTPALREQCRAAGADHFFVKPVYPRAVLGPLQRLAGTAVPVILSATGTPPASPLSDREEQVLKLLAYGYSNKELAARFGVSVKTVETFKARAWEKLGLHSRAELVRHAIGRGWLLDPDPGRDLSSPSASSEGGG